MLFEWHIVHPYDPDDVLNKLNSYVPLKPDSVRSPNVYLGMKLNSMQLYDSIWALSISPLKYIQKAVRICEEYVMKH